MTRMRLKRAIDEYLDYVGRKKGPSTYQNYQRSLVHFLASAGNINVGAINAKTIKKFEKRLSGIKVKWTRQSRKAELAQQPRKKPGEDGKELTERTRSLYLSAVRGLLKYLAKGNIQTYPLGQIEFEKIEKKLPDYLTPEQVPRLCRGATAVASDDFTRVRNLAIVQCLYSSGVRVSELISIGRTSIDLRRGMVKVKGKGRKEREVFFSPSAIKTLRKYLAMRKDELPDLFVATRELKPKKIRVGPKRYKFVSNFKSRRLRRQDIWEIVKTAAQKARLKEFVSPHTLRHSFATTALNRNFNIREVADSLGHEHVSTTEIYTHTSNVRILKKHRRAFR